MSDILHCLLAAVLLLGAVAEPAVAEPEHDADNVIQIYDLEIAPAPVKAREDWRPPQRILVMDAGAERMQWLREAVPGVELVGARTLADVTGQLARVDAVIGVCNTAVLEQGKQLRWIQLYTAGVEKCLNLPAFSERKPLLTNMQRVAAPVIAEHAIAIIMSLSRKLPAFQQAQRGGEWRRDAASTAGMQVINGKTLLVVGLGGIGTEVARRAHALGMRVTATRASSREGPDFVSEVGLPEDLPRLVAAADVVVNSLPLVDSTRQLFNQSLFKVMKKSTLFINVGRGATVVTGDLLAALNKGQIAGAGLDVTDPEPLPPGHPLWHAPNTIITPHVATRSDLDAEGKWQVVRENLRRYAAGKPMLSVVDPQRGY